MTEPARPAAVDPRLLAGLSPRPAPPAQPAAGESAPSAPAVPSAPTAAPAPGVPSAPAASAPTTAPAPADGSDRDRGDGETGHPAVDAALGALARAGQLPPDQQISMYESAHRTLQETLRTIEQG